MFELKITGFNTKAEAEAFASWYEGQGEQDACIWFECRKDDGEIDVDSMMVDCRATYPMVWDGNQTTMVVKPS
jgi:hypothetical protein